jgi:hypothetical protein
MSTSFKALRELIAGEVEPRSWGKGTSTSTGGSTIVSSTNFRMDAGDDRALDGGWLYWTSGALLGEERPIIAAGLAASTGDISVANPFSATTPSAATFEVHLRYPVKASFGTLWTNGYLEMVNDALSRLWFEDWISVTGVSGQTRYLLDVATYPWLADRPKDRVLDIYGPRDATSNVRRSTSYHWHIDDDAEAPELVFDSGSYNTGETFFLKVARPCHTRIKISGTWTDVTPSALNGGYFGLAADSDETHAIPSHVLAMVVTASMNAMGMRQPAIEADRWEGRRRYWAEVARQIKTRRLPRKYDGRVRLRAVGLGGGMMSGRS